MHKQPLSTARHCSALWTCSSAQTATLYSTSLQYLADVLQCTNSHPLQHVTAVPYGRAPVHKQPPSTAQHNTCGRAPVHKQPPSIARHCSALWTCFSAQTATLYSTTQHNTCGRAPVHKQPPSTARHCSALWTCFSAQTATLCSTTQHNTTQHLRTCSSAQTATLYSTSLQCLAQAQRLGMQICEFFSDKRNKQKSHISDM